MIAWVALALALLELAFLAGVTALALRFVARVRPQIAPYLELAGLYAPSASSVPTADDPPPGPGS